jgi:hypothetical protein
VSRPRILGRRPRWNAHVDPAMACYVARPGHPDDAEVEVGVSPEAAGPGSAGPSPALGRGATRRPRRRQGRRVPALAHRRRRSEVWVRTAESIVERCGLRPGPPDVSGPPAPRHRRRLAPPRAYATVGRRRPRRAAGRLAGLAAFGALLASQARRGAATARCASSPEQRPPGPSRRWLVTAHAEVHSRPRSRAGSTSSPT